MPSKYQVSLILKKSAFVHIPKTGGVWVTEALNNAGLVVEEHKRHSKLLNTTLPVIVSVRNPIHWYKSRWSSPDHQKRLRDMKPYDGLLSAAGELGYDFTTWVKNLLEDNGFLTKLYAEFMGEDFERPAFVCYNENLTDDLIKGLRFLGERFNGHKIRDTPTLNTSRRLDKNKTVLPPKLIRQIFESEELIFKKFNYPMTVKNYL